MIKQINAQELKEKNETSTSHVVINVLGFEYYMKCHISGSINIPNDNLEDQTADWPKDREIIVYCANSMCPASRVAWMKLTELGFTNVRAYEGGIKEWQDLGYPVDGDCA